MLESEQERDIVARITECVRTDAFLQKNPLPNEV